jgi:glutamate carboxypeptidase
MTGRDAEIVSWLHSQQARLLDTVTDWAGISSSSLDPIGLDRMADALSLAFGRLGEVVRHPVPPRVSIDDRGREVIQPLGDVLSIRHEAPRERLRVLLGIHYDTVYPGNDSPPHASLSADGRILRGPGVADAKGGLAVLLAAIEAAMHFEVGETLSWEMLLNADEEIGSPGSAGFLTEAAGRADVGLVFEPALDEAGTLAEARKGSGNFHVVIRGRAAHAGRSIADGRNAVVAAAELATSLGAIGDAGRDLTVNVASLHGGEALNVVPDLAVLRINARAAADAEAAWFTSQIEDAVARLNRREGFSASLTGGFHCPPKPLDAATRLLLDHAATCGRDLGLTITSRPTGGACDGNKLAAAGLPTLDTLGVRGGGIHSPEEYLVVESLTERSALTALFLARLADGSLDWPRGAHRSGSGSPGIR